MSSKFHVFQLWCTKCLPAGRIQKHAQHFLLLVLARFGNSRGHRGIASPKYWQIQEPPVLHSEPRPTPRLYWRDSKHGGIAFPAESLSPKYLAVPKRRHNHVHNAFPQVLAGVTAESLSPKYGHSHKRDSESIGGVAFPKYWRFLDPRCGVAVSGMRGCGALRGKKYGVCQGE